MQRFILFLLVLFLSTFALASTPAEDQAVQDLLNYSDKLTVESLVKKSPEIRPIYKFVTSDLPSGLLSADEEENLKDSVKRLGSDLAAFIKDYANSTVEVILKNKEVIASAALKVAICVMDLMRKDPMSFSQRLMLLGPEVIFLVTGVVPDIFRQWGGIIKNYSHIAVRFTEVFRNAINSSAKEGR